MKKTHKLKRVISAKREGTAERFQEKLSVKYCSASQSLSQPSLGYT